MTQAAASSVTRDMETAMHRLSTGKRINAARDDAAGVAISSRLSSEIRGTQQAIRNAMDAQALVDTAEGGLVEVENILQRMREIAVQSSNGTNSTNDRTALDEEYQALEFWAQQNGQVKASWMGQAGQTVYLTFRWVHQLTVQTVLAIVLQAHFLTQLLKLLHLACLLQFLIVATIMDGIIKTFN